MKRHPQFAKRVADHISRATACVNFKDIKAWFNSVHTALSQQQMESILFEPDRIFNADETGFMLDPKKGYVIAPKGAKRVHNVSENDKFQMTVMLTVCANGALYTPFIVYPGVRLHGTIANKLAVQTTKINYTLTDSGWETTISMIKYIEAFDKVQKPVLLFLDGHVSHDNFEVSRVIKYS